MTARQRVEDEVQEIIAAARNVIQAAEEIPDAPAPDDDDRTADQLAEAEAVMRGIYQRHNYYDACGPDDLTARELRVYFRKYHPQEVTL